MNRRSLLKLGALAAVAPKALGAPVPRVSPYAGWKAWLPVTEGTDFFGLERTIAPGGLAVALAETRAENYYRDLFEHAYQQALGQAAHLRERL